jgi:Cu/Ag efflux protein CusF
VASGGGTGAAETPGHGQAAGHGQLAQAAGPKPSGVGTINAVHPDRRMVNVSHEPIPSVGFPAMTMDLGVAPSVDLGAVRPGSRVTFTLARGPDGVYLIDSIKPSSGSGAPGSSPPAGGSMPGHGSPMPGMGHGTMPMPGGQPPPKGSSP